MLIQRWGGGEKMATVEIEINLYNEFKEMTWAEIFQKLSIFSDRSLKALFGQGSQLKRLSDW